MRGFLAVEDDDFVGSTFKLDGCCFTSSFISVIAFFALIICQNSVLVIVSKQLDFLFSASYDGNRPFRNQWLDNVGSGNFNLWFWKSCSRSLYICSCSEQLWVQTTMIWPWSYCIYLYSGLFLFTCSWISVITNWKSLLNPFGHIWLLKALSVSSFC